MKLKVQSWIVLLLVLYFSTGRSKAQDFPFVNHTEVGVLMSGVRSGTPASFSLHTFNGVSISPATHVGFTTGIDVYAENTVLPLALGWRGILQKGKFSPIAGLDVGFGSAILEKNNSSTYHKGGFFLHPRLGIVMKTKGSGALSLMIGFQKQSFSQIQNHGDPTSNFSTTSFLLPPGVVSRTEQLYQYHRMSVKVGVFF